jgi:hypothetical protein
MSARCLHFLFFEGPQIDSLFLFLTSQCALCNFNKIKISALSFALSCNGRWFAIWLF